MKRFLSTALLLSGTLFSYLPSAASPSAQNLKPAVVTAVSVLGDNKGFYVVASVQLPSPCYSAIIEKSPLLIYPPHYLVLQQHNGGICKAVVTPRTVKQHFDQMPWPKHVDVFALDLHRQPHHWRLPIIVETR